MDKTKTNLGKGFEVGKTITRTITELNNGVLSYEVVKPLLFNRTQRHIIIHHPSKLNEWNLIRLFYHLIRFRL